MSPLDPEHIISIPKNVGTAIYIPRSLEVFPSGYGRKDSNELLTNCDSKISYLFGMLEKYDDLEVSEYRSQLMKFLRSVGYENKDSIIFHEKPKYYLGIRGGISLGSIVHLLENYDLLIRFLFSEKSTVTILKNGEGFHYRTDSWISGNYDILT